MYILLGDLINFRLISDHLPKNTVYFDSHSIGVCNWYGFDHILTKIKRKIFWKNLTVEIWNLNLKISPLENRKNNGGAISKFLGSNLSKFIVFMISGLRTTGVWFFSIGVFIWNSENMKKTPQNTWFSTVLRYSNTNSSRTKMN